MHFRRHFVAFPLHVIRPDKRSLLNKMSIRDLFETHCICHFAHILNEHYPSTTIHRCVKSLLSSNNDGKTSPFNNSKITYTLNFSETYGFNGNTC